MADSLETSIIIKAIDQATAVLNDVKKSLGDVDKVVTDSKNTVKSYSQQLKTRAEDNKEHFSNLSKTSGTAFAAVSA
ncbi:MAG: hypothetical protein LBU27_06105 [Candidatus Peribacteria bacterium]|jgi:predicted DNA-binding ArsR family transcriptional regulator|nr:hypothetical protein [Candidatus Peribacteria bacterium]